MKCSKCQHENPEDATFCNECGKSLQVVCDGCGKDNAPGSKFCNECGKRLEVAMTGKGIREPEGERKYVTAMFSDLSGYTTMSEKLDPEEVKEIMSRIFGEIAQVVTKYEGFIEKFIGDAAVADFRSMARRISPSLHTVSISPQLQPELKRMCPLSNDPSSIGYLFPHLHQWVMVGYAQEPRAWQIVYSMEGIQ